MDLHAPQVYTDVSYLLTMNEASTFAQFFSCVDDVTSYLVDHGNWRDSIFQPITDCPELVPNDTEFTVDETTWIC